MTPGEEFTYQKDPLNISYHSQPYRRRRHRRRWKSKKQVSNVEDAISPSSQILPPVTKPSGRTPCARKSEKVNDVPVVRVRPASCSSNPVILSDCVEGIPEPEGAYGIRDPYADEILELEGSYGA